MSDRLSDERVTQLNRVRRLACSTCASCSDDVIALAAEVQRSRYVIPGLQTELALAKSEIERLRGVDKAHRLHVRAVLARRGLAPQHLDPWWSPDTDSMVNPIGDAETVVVIRRTMRELWEHGTIPDEVQS